MSGRGGKQALGLVGFIILVASAILIGSQCILVYAFKGSIPHLEIITPILTLLAFIVVAWVGWNFVAGKHRVFLIIYIVSLVIIVVLLLLQILGVINVIAIPGK